MKTIEILLILILTATLVSWGEFAVYEYKVKKSIRVRCGYGENWYTLKRSEIPEMIEEAEATRGERRAAE